MDLFGECRRGRSGVLSLQALLEYFVTATRKLGLAPEVARGKTEIFGRLDVVLPEVDDALGAAKGACLEGRGCSVK